MEKEFDVHTEPTAEEMAAYFKDTNDHISKVQAHMMDAVDNLQVRYLTHDMTKYSEIESKIYAKVVPLFKGKTYGTPEHKAVGDMLGPAWEHHLRHNDHHPQHHINGINDMSLMSIIEMICDWKAAGSRDPNQDFRKSFSLNCEKYGADAQLTNIIMNTAEELGMF